MWWAVGYGLGFGDDKTLRTRNQFIGNSDFMLLGKNVDFANWVFQWSFAASRYGVLLLVGTNFVALLLYLVPFVNEWLHMHTFCTICCMCSIIVTSFLSMPAFIYPVISHWIWSNSGWLSGFNKDMGKVGTVGALDFAGGVVVHFVGGLVGKWFQVRFDDYRIDWCHCLWSSLWTFP